MNFIVFFNSCYVRKEMPSFELHFRLLFVLKVFIVL
jgi:hypothetical protein